ncbi:MAG: undecaprenyl-diphosphate phosphatase [Pseudomonadales bacterium]
MDAVQAIVLALVQGLTEFLPISSSAHLILPSAVLGWPDQGLAFDVAVHVGSLLAVVAYFYRDIWSISSAWCGSLVGRGTNEQSQLGWAVIIGTIPAGLAGILLNGWIEANLRSVSVIATATIGFGLLLWWADGKRGQLGSVGLRNAIVIGLAQALALIPGTSRSGITMTAGLALGLNRQTAARFSFLLSIPLILAAGGLKTLELLEQGDAVEWAMIFLGVAVSAVAAFACIHLFLKWLDRVGFMPFVIYRILLGIGLWLLIALNWI